ncbi:unnamed protein product [Prorocentrum cordatum]|uniref:Amino acid transporter transmembrane domain-containing protein n=1 Tax=Prorocentrum cordatum TaxID=2364126 RepID=A0ABN9PIU8_9DINO|nr:unnamed protein product [Polarella glacialis]
MRGWAWLTVPPADAARSIEPALFKMALGRRLRIRVQDADMFCPMCGGTMDSFGDHTLVCPCSGDRTVRHNRLRDSVFEDALRGHMGPEREKPGLLPERPRDDGTPPSSGGGDAPGVARSRRRPAGAFFLRALGGTPAALDFACTSGLRADVLRDAATNPESVLSAYEDFKRSLRRLERPPPDLGHDCQARERLLARGAAARAFEDRSSRGSPREGATAEGAAFVQVLTLTSAQMMRFASDSPWGFYLFNALIEVLFANEFEGGLMRLRVNEGCGEARKLNKCNIHAAFNSLRLAPWMECWGGQVNVIQDGDPHGGAARATAEQIFGAPPPSALERPLRAGLRARQAAAGVGGPSSPVAVVADGSAGSSGGSSPLQTGMNMLKNVAGSGSVALPAGVAALSTQPSAVVPATALLLAVGAASAFGFALLGRACAETGADSYKSAWALSVGRWKWFPRVLCAVQTLIELVFFAIVITNCTVMSLEAVRLLPAVPHVRMWIAWALSAFVFLPLCCIRDLSGLSRFSLAGIMALVGVLGAVTLRALDGTYAPGGRLFLAAPVRPFFAAGAGSPGAMLAKCVEPCSVTLLAVLTMSFMAHYNAPALFAGMRSRESPAGSAGAAQQKLRTFYAVVAGAFAASAVLYSVLMWGGFLTFGGAVAGSVLDSYAPIDPAATCVRVLFALSLMPTFALSFAGFASAAGGPLAAASRPRRLAATAAVVAAVAAVTSCVSDVGRVGVLGGALCGSFISFVVPAAMDFALGRGAAPSRLGRARRVCAGLLVPFGLCSCVLGVATGLR